MHEATCGGDRASSGIGRATALRLAAAGYHIYGGVRRADDGESVRREAPAGRLTRLVLDVTDDGQVSAGAKTVAGHVGDDGLTALVDNAGIGVTGPLELTPVEEIRRQFDVNVVGQVAVTQAFLPLLRAAARGRIVLIGSVGGRIAIPFGGPLAASKSAIASLTDALRQELAPWGVRVILLEPGSITTEAVDKLERDARRTVEGFPAESRDLYRSTYLEMIRRMAANERNGSPPGAVAEAVATALGARRPRARYLVGKDARTLATVGLLPTPVLDAVRRRILGLPAPGSRTARSGRPRDGRR